MKLKTYYVLFNIENQYYLSKDFTFTTDFTKSWNWKKKNLL